jgi:hypothetical protein
LEQELGATGAWSLELGAVGAGELWLEPERDPRGTHVSIFTFFLVCLFCLFCLFFFAMFLWSCTAMQRSEESDGVTKKGTAAQEGDGSFAIVSFFFFFFFLVA